MMRALTLIIEPKNLAFNYYSKREYKKDGCKLGKKLHPQLIAAWDLYFKNEILLRSFVAQYYDKISVSELASTKKKYGKKIRYHFQKMRMDGKMLIIQFEKAIASETPDFAALQKTLDVFRTTQEGAAELYEKEKAKKKSKIKSQFNGGGYTYFVRAGKNWAGTVEETIKIV